jgi:hypothetical protein
MNFESASLLELFSVLFQLWVIFHLWVTGIRHETIPIRVSPLQQCSGPTKAALQDEGRGEVWRVIFRPNLVPIDLQRVLTRQMRSTCARRMVAPSSQCG